MKTRKLLKLLYFTAICLAVTSLLSVFIRLELETDQGGKMKYDKRLVFAYSRSWSVTDNKWLVFSSVGDNANTELWPMVSPRRKFDLVLIYYGDNQDSLEQRFGNHANYIYGNKGTKYQNLKWFIESHPEIYARYNAVWAIDDDFEILNVKTNKMDANIDMLGSMHRMFEIREKVRK